jgi:DICT domain-containing protein
MQMASKQRAGPRGRAEHRRQCDEEERQRRVAVIAEFDAGDSDATMHALADEILKLPPSYEAACRGH